MSRTITNPRPAEVLDLLGGNFSTERPMYPGGFREQTLVGTNGRRIILRDTAGGPCEAEVLDADDLARVQALVASIQASLPGRKLREAS